jgi:RNA methyltransferase, TrmH family
MLDLLPQHQIYQVSSDLMEKASYRENPGGLVTVMQQKQMLTLTALPDHPPALMLALVALTKPGNIGALLRTADATGVEFICLIDSALDIYNPNIIRASTGTVFLNNLITASTAQAIQYFQAHHYQIVAAHLAGTQSLYDTDFTSRPTVIVFGTEDQGLDDSWVNSCDVLVRIPMIGKIADSLNVSVSGAVFLYEALRQRQLIL